MLSKSAATGTVANKRVFAVALIAAAGNTFPHIVAPVIF